MPNKVTIAIEPDTIVFMNILYTIIFQEENRKTAEYESIRKEA